MIYLYVDVTFHADVTDAAYVTKAETLTLQVPGYCSTEVGLYLGLMLTDWPVEEHAVLLVEDRWVLVF